MQHLLFVYGTLLLTDNDFARYLQQHAHFVTPGKTKGMLYDIGEYPGLVNNSSAHNWVYGSVYKTDNETLKLIDDYEGYGPGQEEPYLYLRMIQEGTTDSGLLKAWVYVYNHNINDLKPIPTGNYTEYLEQKKSRDA